MKADDFRLLFQKHCDVLGTDITRDTPRLRHRTQSVGIVVRLQMPPHRLAGFRGVSRLRPERVVDVETAGAQLAKASDAACGFFRRQTPHANAAETACIADRRRQRRGRDKPHRRQHDRIFEFQPFSQRI